MTEGTHNHEKCDHDHQETAHENDNKKLDMAALEEKYNVVGHLKTGFTRPVIVHRAIFGSL